MSYGPVKVARSPTPDTIGLVGAMQGLSLGPRPTRPAPPLRQADSRTASVGAMSIPREIPSPASPAPTNVPQYVVSAPFPKEWDPKVKAFCETQRKIGASWPQVVRPMKYHISVYRLTDAGCYSSIDSPDWRKRELSIWETETAIDLIINKLRTDIAAASLQAWKGTTPQNFKERMQNHFVTKFPFSSVPDFPRANPTETTPTERYRFPVQEKTQTVLIGVPQAKLLEIAKRMLSFPVNDIRYSTGPVLGQDLQCRVRNIFAKFMQPERDCMRSLIGNPNVPKIRTAEKELVFAEDTMFMPLDDEIAWTMRNQGMDPRLVDSLVELDILSKKKGFEELVNMIMCGETGDSIGFLSW